MIFSMQDRVTFVSGAGPGLGAQMAATLLELGGSVVVADLDADVAARTAAGLSASSERVLSLRCDIRSEEDCQAAIAATKERFGRLDGLVNVAALDTVVGGLLSGGVESWPAVASVNVEGTLRMTKHAAPLLAESGRGAVVLIGSTSATRPRKEALRLAYGASKGALASATRYLAVELGALGVTVNNIAPGFKDGPTLQRFFASEARRLGLAEAEVTAPYLEELAIARFATDADVAATAAFFLSGSARSITGQTLYVDGGHVME